MPEFELPRRLVESVEAYDDEGSPRRTWLAALPLVVDDLARRWSLKLGSPFQPGGSASWVAPASDAAGIHLVLKVGWRHDEAMHEAHGLRMWHGAGAVRLIEALEIGETSALLLEACEPGVPLAEARPPLEQDEVVAGLLPRLWITPPHGHPFRTLQNMCDWWADEFKEKYDAARGARIDVGLATAGIEVFRRLPSTADRHVMLCTDLHPENVLAAQREPWLVIDPKPYVGDPTYDALQHMLNFDDRLAADPFGFVRRMAGLLDLDPDRLRQWLFARCVQESVDQPHLHAVAAALAP